jgi:hypothetical protein
VVIFSEGGRINAIRPAHHSRSRLVKQEEVQLRGKLMYTQSSFKRNEEAASSQYFVS